MARSDCPKCWDTPCSCGYVGERYMDLIGRPDCNQDEEKEQLIQRIKELELEISKLKSSLANAN